MNIHELFDILLNHSPLPSSLRDTHSMEDLKTYLIPLITTSVYTKRQLLLSAGQVAVYIYFLEKGFARGFYIHPQTKKEVTHFLWNRDSIITVPDSFYKQTPSYLFIEVMPQTQLVAISYDQLMACKKVYPVIEVFSRNVILQYNAYEAKRNYDMASLSAWERYLRLLQTHPDIEQQVSKEVIASYLDITPQSLSRMLKEKRHP